MRTLTTEQFIEMERRDKRRCAVLALVLVANIVVLACQPPSPNTSPSPHAQTPVSLGPVIADGTCKATLGVDLQVGILSLPIRANLDTHASPGGASGTVGLDIGGLLSAQCTMVAGEGACAVSGLLAPRETPAPAPALSEGGADASP